jgi:peptide-methionine (S)-S-oxide reductase
MHITYIFLSLWLGALLIGGSTVIPRVSLAAEENQYAKAIFAGGCFWCMEEAYEMVNGVISVISGYTGGKLANPTYEQVSAGGTGHTESVEVIYDPNKVTYQHLLEVFWHNIDPTALNAQFCDHGTQYRSAIFYHDEMQKQLIDESKQAIESSKSFPQPIVTEIVPASVFYPAEEYHQNFYKKNPVRYKFYKWNCGRSQRLEQLWGKS